MAGQHDSRPRGKDHLLLPPHCVILRLAKYPSVPGPTNRATAPSESPSFISLTIKQGWAASWTNRRAFVPSITILYFVHTPGSRSTYDSYFSGDSFRSLSKSNSGYEAYWVEWFRRIWSSARPFVGRR